MLHLMDDTSIGVNTGGRDKNNLMNHKSKKNVSSR